MSAKEPSPDAPTDFRSPEETPTVVVEESHARLSDLTPGTLIGDRYRVVSLIGRGGMGEVYRADDLKLGQAVALKFRSRHGDAQRLYEEVRIGRQVSHPNVCRLYDIAEVGGHLFITMEFVDGEDLASLLRRVGRLPSEKALAVTRDICAGLAAAHEKGVIHRDLKPANVMIDGRGRARVTDFGLAVAGEHASDGAGTPAYMAPEQLSGEPASTQSDIYALGLVLYELFTGKRTFDASSTLDLLGRQQRGDFARPSVLTRDVPAPVERVIVRCLDPNPSSRPDSVEGILRELPGGDALAAAIAAGETPSPAMVAASTDRGELSQPAALSCIAIFTLVLLASALLAPFTMLHRRVPIKSPEVLQERISEVLAATHQDLPRADWSAIFTNELAGSQPQSRPSILYVYRQSPRPMSPANFEHRVLSHDPPLIYSGMADVALQSDGRLRQFVIVPPQAEDVAQPVGDVDWQPFLRLAGLEGALTPVRPAWSTVVDTDRKQAWALPDGTRVEAASYHGKPVSFQVIRPSARAWRMSEQTETGSRIATFAVITIYTLFVVAAGWLALRNLRRGQGDRRGARRIGTMIAVTSFLAGLLLAHHVAYGYDEMINVSTTAGIALLGGALASVGYIAIEPLIRRRWPRMLISEARLISGLVRDPMVGRDLLVGATAGLSVSLLRQLSVFMPGGSQLQTANLALSGVRYVGWFVGAGIALATYGPIIGATLLVAIHALTRNLRVTMVILTLLGAPILLGDATGPLWSRAVLGLVGALTVFWLLFRFGLLAYSSAVFVYIFIRRMPITLDPGDWFFGRSLLGLTLVFAIAFYGFVTSLGGKKWLPEPNVE